MSKHITKICVSSFFYLYNIRRIRNYLSQTSNETLIYAFVSSRLNYWNSLLYGLPDFLLNKLQRVQNSSARLIFNEHKFCQTTPLIMELNWLPIRLTIEFKILLITFEILHGLAPYYLSYLLLLLGVHQDIILGTQMITFYLATLGFISKASRDRSFTCAARKLWNALPFDVRCAKSVAVFKFNLKTHLFRYRIYSNKRPTSN